MNYVVMVERKADEMGSYVAFLTKELNETFIPSKVCLYATREDADTVAEIVSDKENKAKVLKLSHGMTIAKIFSRLAEKYESA